jgi:hypothetical protein
VTRGGWRLRVARWLAPAQALEKPEVPGAWAEVCEQFAFRLLVLTEQMRPALDGLESSEEDPDRLAQLYQLDHGITRMRRVARDLGILSGRASDEIAGHTTALLDVIRMAASAIEHYSRVSIGPVAELAVLAYAADDVASLLAALADNGTRYSPAQVTVSAHLLADGAVMLRVEDEGLGIEPAWLPALNTAMADPVPPAGMINGRHTGFAVIHRLASRHGLRVYLARREPPPRVPAAGVSGTIAMVLIPPALLCEIPPPEPPASNRHARQHAVVTRPEADPQAVRPAAPAGPVPAAVTPEDQPTLGPGDALPRREPQSIRTPSRPAPAAAGPGEGQDHVAAGFAFAVDLQAFSTGQGTAGPGAAEVGENHSRDGEGHMP